MNNSEPQTKQEMFDTYIDLLRSKFKTDEFEKFQDFLLQQRDLFLIRTINDIGLICLKHM